MRPVLLSLWAVPAKSGYFCPTPELRDGYIGFVNWNELHHPEFLYRLIIDWVCIRVA